MSTWQIIVSIIIVMVIFFSIENRRSQKRKQQARREMLPEAQPPIIRSDRPYTVILSDGRQFAGVHILGHADGEHNPLFGWDGLFVLRFADGRRAFVRQGSVRCLVEERADG